MQTDSELTGLGGWLVLVVEVIISLVFISGYVYQAFLFFKTHPRFPAWFIGLNVFGIAWVLIDAFAVSAVAPWVPVFDAETTSGLARQSIYALIWIPYMLRSRRVKLTFADPGDTPVAPVQADTSENTKSPIRMVWVVLVGIAFLGSLAAALITATSGQEVRPTSVVAMMVWGWLFSIGARTSVIRI